MLVLGKQFRPSTSIVYPPFKNGRYMEEYFYDNFRETKRVYIPIFWTNLQNHPAFSTQKHKYDLLLSEALSKMPPNTEYYTVVQHDDGPQLKLPKNTIIFGACTGSVPLPLIYEDKDEKLVKSMIKNTSKNTIQPKYLASFVGSTTHPIRQKIYDTLIGYQDIYIKTQNWDSKVSQESSELFVDVTLQSKFCLAPRGYGRSSFRFFEAILLNVVPVYFWDVKWLPYDIDYSEFSVLIQEKDIPRTYEILTSISNEKYESMVKNLEKVKHLFTLKEMSEYIYRF